MILQGFRSVYKPQRAGRGFAELLDAVAGVGPELRVRFTSPHPKDFSDDVIDVRFLRMILATCSMLLSSGDFAWHQLSPSINLGLWRLHSQCTHGAVPLTSVLVTDCNQRV